MGNLGIGIYYYYRDGELVSTYVPREYERIIYPTQIPGLSNITYIASSYEHALAVRNDGTVWGFGSNREGRLGREERREWGFMWDISSPTQISNLSNIIAVSAGTYHSLALRNDGTVWAWGSNLSGRLGNGTTESSYTPVQAQGLNGVIMVHAFNASNIALQNGETSMSVPPSADPRACAVPGGLSADMHRAITSTITANLRK